MKNCPKKILEEKLIRESKASLRLGEMLIRAGKISRNNLLTAIEKQKTFNKRIGQIFIMMNLITPEELSLYLMEQKWIDRLELDDFEVDHELVEMIGKDFCLEKKIIPIELYELNQKKVLRLVVFSRDDLLVLKNSERLKDYVLIPYDALPEDINRLLLEIKNYDVMLLK
jgi:type IV pilus assembly protein PilB